MNKILFSILNSTVVRLDMGTGGPNRTRRDNKSALISLFERALRAIRRPEQL